MATLEARCTPKGSAASPDSDDWSATRWCFGRRDLKSAAYHHPSETAQPLAHLHARSNIDARKLQRTLLQLRNLRFFRGAIGPTSGPRQIGPMVFARGLVEVLGLAQAQAEVPDLGWGLALSATRSDVSTTPSDVSTTPETCMTPTRAAPQLLLSPAYVLLRSEALAQRAEPFAQRFLRDRRRAVERDLGRDRVGPPKEFLPAAGQNVRQNVEVLW